VHSPCYKHWPSIPWFPTACWLPHTPLNPLPRWRNHTLRSSVVPPHSPGDTVRSRNLRCRKNSRNQRNYHIRGMFGLQNIRRMNCTGLVVHRGIRRTSRMLSMTFGPVSNRIAEQLAGGRVLPKANSSLTGCGVGKVSPSLAAPMTSWPDGGKLQCIHRCMLTDLNNTVKSVY